MSSISRPKVCANLLTSAKLHFSTSSASFKSHYDTLGITRQATQSDIKSAYYKLTKVYHPDKNTSAEAKVKFRDITDAYEILGNYKSRKMYDRGMRPGPRHIETKTAEERRKEDAQTRFYKSRLHRTQVEAVDGRTPIYNFDEWAKAHYGDLFNQAKKIKEAATRLEIQKESEQRTADKSKLWLPVILAVVVFSTMFSTYRINDNYDTNRLVSRKKES